MSLLKVITVLGALILVSGCSQSADTSDLKRYTQDIMAKPRGRIEPIPVFKPYEFFNYSASALRSPFQLPQSESESDSLNITDSKVRPDQNRAKQYLEQFPLGQLSMVGTLATPDGDRWALVRDGNGGVVRIKKGEYMGQSFGRVTSITENNINIIEIVPSGMGGWLERPRTIVMKGMLGE
ncbi:MAG: pilus assembly protein PilP [Oleibacter sp.]|nr:pilus assembly protein PilP [Thalassolituus sp.]